MLQVPVLVSRWFLFILNLEASERTCVATVSWDTKSISLINCLVSCNSRLSQFMVSNSKSHYLGHLAPKQSQALAYAPSLTPKEKTYTISCWTNFWAESVSSCLEDVRQSRLWHGETVLLTALVGVEQGKEMMSHDAVVTT